MRGYFYGRIASTKLKGAICGLCYAAKDTTFSALRLSVFSLRFSLPNSRIMVHQPSGGYQGQVTDIEIQTKEIIKTKKRLNEIYAKHTGKDITNVELIMERDKYFSPAEAIEFGLIDKIVEDRK